MGAVRSLYMYNVHMYDLKPVLIEQFFFSLSFFRIQPLSIQKEKKNI